MNYRQICLGWLAAWLLGIAAPAADRCWAQQAQETANAAAVHFNLAAEFQNLGTYDKAAEKWATFLTTYPKDARVDKAQFYLGVCQLHLKKYAEAEASFRALLKAFPAYPQADGAQYNLAMAVFESSAVTKKPEDYKKAATEFVLVADKHAASKFAPPALYYQGEALFHAADLKGAVAAYSRLLTAFPNSELAPDALYGLGTTQQDLAAEADATVTFQKFLSVKEREKHPLAGEIRLRLGNSLFTQKKFADAEKEFDLVAKTPEFPLADFALLRQGMCRIEQNKLPEAAATFAELIAKFPKSTYLPAAQLAAGRCYYLTDKPDEALKQLAPLSATAAPEAAEAAHWLGRTLLKQKKPAEALAALEAAVQKFTTGDFVPYLQLARLDALYELPDRRPQTAALYAEFVTRFPEHVLTPQALYLAGLAGLSDGKHADARTRAEAFLANPKYATHELRPAVLYVAAEANLLQPAPDAAQKQAALAKADALYRELIAKYPEHLQASAAQVRIGWCLAQLNKSAEAIAHLTAALPKLKQPEQLAEAQLLIGRSQAALGQHKEAVVSLNAAQAALPTWPRNDEVLLAAAQSQRAIPDLPGATARLAALLAAYPSSPLRPAAIFLTGEIAAGQGQHDVAIAQFQELRQKHPQSEFAPSATYALAGSLFAKNDYPATIAALTELLAAKPNPELIRQATYLRGIANQRAKQFDPAVLDLQAFLALQPPPSPAELQDARYLLALCQIAQGKPADGQATLALLLKENAKYANADQVYYELGHAHLKAGNLLPARDAFFELSKAFPESPLAAESLFHVGHYHELLAEKAKTDDERTKEIAQAALHFAAALKVAKVPELREKLQYKSGDMLHRQGKFAEAATVLLEQVKELPQGTLAGPGRFLAAESLYRAAKPAEALPLFVQVADAKVEKYHAQALYRAGACAAELKQWPESQKHFAALVTAFPKFPQLGEARYAVGVALQNQNKLDEAAAELTQVVNLGEGETAAKARFMLGEIAFAKKQFEPAIEQFLTVAVGSPYPNWQALSRFEAGRCFMELKQKDNAIKQFQVVVEKFAAHPRAADSAKLIAELKK